MTQARVPQAATLRKYGLTRDEWIAILARQNGGCGICGRVPASGTLCTDHQHVRNWKHMPPEERKKYVRGILCFGCNTSLRYRVTTPWLETALAYMKAYEACLTNPVGRVKMNKAIRQAKGQKTIAIPH